MDVEVLSKLWDIVLDRKNNPVEGSYTVKLFNNPELLAEKIREESQELVDSAKEGKTGKDSIEWECADLIYHMMVFLAANDIDFNEVLKELEGRMK